MTATATKGRVGYRRMTWNEALAEINNDERFPADTTYALLQRTEDIKFKTKKDAAAKGLFEQQWSEGRLFNADYELQWEKQGDAFQLRLLTEGDLPDGWQVAEFETDEETSLLLFGEHKRDTDPGWREARIPRWLEYPVAKTLGRVRLIAIPYAKEGMVVRMRLKGVKSA
jgi:hypothetical protein